MVGQNEDKIWILREDVEHSSPQEVDSDQNFIWTSQENFPACAILHCKLPLHVQLPCSCWCCTLGAGWVGQDCPKATGRLDWMHIFDETSHDTLLLIVM